MDDELIFSYTRADAIADGVLIDVTEMAKEAGFKFPVAITEAINQGYVSPSSALKDQGQSYEGRLWDLLMVMRLSCAGSSGDTVLFDVLFLTEKGQQKVKFKAVIGPGDRGEPVITVMLPHED